MDTVVCACIYNIYLRHHGLQFMNSYILKSLLLSPSKKYSICRVLHGYSNLAFLCYLVSTPTFPPTCLNNARSSHVLNQNKQRRTKQLAV